MKSINDNSTLNTLLPKDQKRYVVVDFETTGFKNEDHIIEIGAHEIKNGQITLNYFYTLIYPRKKYAILPIKKIN